jgi:hypothetical protein
LSPGGTGGSCQLALQIHDGKFAGGESQRINGDLKLGREASHARHFRNSFDRGELMLDLPILHIAEFPQVVAGSFHGVPENLSRGGCIRRETRRDSGWQVRIEHGQTFSDLAAGRLQVRATFEDYVDHRVIEITGAAQGPNSRNPLQAE